MKKFWFLLLPFAMHASAIKQVTILDKQIAQENPQPPKPEEPPKLPPQPTPPIPEPLPPPIPCVPEPTVPPHKTEINNETSHYKPLSERLEPKREVDNPPGFEFEVVEPNK